MAADAIHDGTGLGYSVTTPAFALIVAAIFALWYRSEGTLSIRSIDTRRREYFYWAAVLGTFALGTAAGDLTAAPSRSSCSSRWSRTCGGTTGAVARRSPCGHATTLRTLSWTSSSLNLYQLTEPAA